MMRRWQAGEHVASTAPQHDCPGQAIPRNPTFLGVRADVTRDHIVLNIFRGQVSLVCENSGPIMASPAARKLRIRAGSDAGSQNARLSGARY